MATMRTTGTDAKLAHAGKAKKKKKPKKKKKKKPAPKPVDRPPPKKY